jgi:hypothetical protein
VFRQHRPDTADPPQSVETQKRSSPHSIGRDAFGDRRRYAGQRIDLRGGRDVEIQLSVDVTRPGV